MSNFNITEVIKTRQSIIILTMILILQLPKQMKVLKMMKINHLHVRKQKLLFLPNHQVISVVIFAPIKNLSNIIVKRV
jgi:hypothetical protein